MGSRMEFWITEYLDPVRDVLDVKFGVSGNRIITS